MDHYTYPGMPEEAVRWVCLVEQIPPREENLEEEGRWRRHPPQLYLQAKMKLGRAMWGNCYTHLRETAPLVLPQLQVLQAGGSHIAGEKDGKCHSYHREEVVLEPSQESVSVVSCTK